MKLITTFFLIFLLLLQSQVIASSNQNLSPKTILKGPPTSKELLKMFWDNLQKDAPEERRNSIFSRFTDSWGRNLSTEHSITIETKFLGFFRLDFSKNFITPRNFKRLANIARWSGLEEKKKAIFRRDKTDDQPGTQPAFHLAFRNRSSDPFFVEGKNIMPQIKENVKKIKEFSQKILSEKKSGFSRKKITQVVHIGADGGELGIKMINNALKQFRVGPKVEFVSNEGSADIQELLKVLDPEKTLFIVASETFTDPETMKNAHAAREWLINQMPNPKNSQTNEIVAKHFVAVSANSEETESFGIDVDSTFQFYNTPEQRHIVWSSLSLTLAITLGTIQYEEFLNGAHSMDKHFRGKAPKSNMPAIMGLLGIWYNDFLNARGHAVLPYEPSLLAFSENVPLNRQAGDITNTVDYNLTPTDFIGFIKSAKSDDATKPNPVSINQDRYLDRLSSAAALFLSQTRALAINGRPTNTLLLDEFSPKTFGALMALYEHRDFVQQAIYETEPYPKSRILQQSIRPSTLEGVNQSSIAISLMNRRVEGDLDGSTKNLLGQYFLRLPFKTKVFGRSS